MSKHWDECQLVVFNVNGMGFMKDYPIGKESSFLVFYFVIKEVAPQCSESVQIFQKKNSRSLFP